MPNLSMTGCEICSFICLKNSAPSYSSQASLQCFEVQSCAAVSWSSFVWSQLLSFTHRCVTLLELLHFPSIFPMFTRQGSFQTFLQGSSKLLINLLVDYIFTALLPAMNALSESQKQFVYIHSPFALLTSNMALSDIFIQLFHWVFFLIRSNRKQTPLKLQRNKIHI